MTEPAINPEQVAKAVRRALIPDTIDTSGYVYQPPATNPEPAPVVPATTPEPAPGVKVTECAWCPDWANPSPKHHPGGQREHAPAAVRAASTTADSPPPEDVISAALWSQYPAELQGRKPNVAARRVLKELAAAGFVVAREAALAARDAELTELRKIKQSTRRNRGVLVDASRRALDALDGLIADNADPGTEALAARHCLDVALQPFSGEAPTEEISDAG